MKPYLIFLLSCCASIISLPGQIPVLGLNGFRVSFTRVPAGMLTDGRYLKTIVHVSNPQPKGVRVIISVSAAFLIRNEDFILPAGGARMFEIIREELRIGDVSVAASEPIATSASIVTFRSPKDQQPLAQVTIPPQRAVSKVAIHVFRRTTNMPGAIADDTAIALSLKQCGGQFLLTLTDPSGRIVATKMLSGGPLPLQNYIGAGASLFLTEIFPNLPPDFSSGTLTIEASQPSPRMFSVMALYTRGNEMWNAPVIELDVPREYLLSFKTGNLQQLAAELSAQYGFRIVDISPSPQAGFALIVATEEVARAVERDPRVLRVSGNDLVCIS